jgi:hypothetical protein
MDKSKCIGCRDDFYNGKNPLGVKECWMLKSAELVTRFRIGTWTRPTEPGAFTKVKVPTCYSAKGYSYFTQLPDFVKRKDVVQ